MHMKPLTKLAVTAACLCVFIPAAKILLQAQGLMQTLTINQRMTASGVSDTDLKQVREKLAMAQPFFVRVWNFNAWNGTSGPLRSVPAFHPYLLAFTHPACGEIAENNAFFCPPANTIFYDEIFLASQMKQTGKAVGSDGDYGALVIVAHELGHAISNRTMQAEGKLEREAMADCVAGAISKMAENAGHLEPGDLKEARAELASGGTRDPDEMSPVLSSLIISAGHWDNHGSAATRLRNFDLGHERGLEACASAAPTPLPGLRLPHN